MTQKRNDTFNLTYHEKKNITINLRQQKEFDDN